MAAPHSIIPQEMQDTFTSAQKEYLAGFLLAVAKRGETFFVGKTASGHITDGSGSGTGMPNLAAPSKEETWFGTPIDDLCKEERWKYEENPLDLWDKLVNHADENRFPEGGDVFRFKFHGLFYVAPAQDSFMLRLRAPACVLRAHQNLPPLMDKLFRSFLRMRMEDESFLAFTRRHRIEQLKELLTVEEQA
jgi:ferredoxin-nitrite reductase